MIGKLKSDIVFLNGVKQKIEKDLQGRLDRKDKELTDALKKHEFDISNLSSEIEKLTYRNDQLEVVWAKWFSRMLN